MAELVLQLKKINKYFGKNHVIKNVDLEFEKGHFITFLGPSGCGKTTLLRMIAGFYEPDDGEILLNDKNIERVPPYNRNTAMVFQEYALFPHMNVFENVSYGLRVKHKPAEEIKKRVAEALSLMQLSGMEKRFPNQMSGGQQQRVAVARALVMNPELLLLDEPLSNLDAKLRESVRVELRDIQQKMGLSTIYVTHDQSEALSMSDRIVVLKDGIVHQVGTPQEIYFEPKTPFVADFIGTTNLIEVKGAVENTVLYAAMCDFIRLAGKKPGFTLIHSAGSEGYAEMVTALRTVVPDYEKSGMDVREYIYDMPRVMAAADLVLCRAGASTESVTLNNALEAFTL